MEEPTRLLSAPELTASVVPAPAAEAAPPQLASPAPAPAAELATAAPSELTETTAPEDSPAELFMAHTNGTAT